MEISDIDHLARRDPYIPGLATSTQTTSVDANQIQIAFHPDMSIIQDADNHVKKCGITCHDFWQETCKFQAFAEAKPIRVRSQTSIPAPTDTQQMGTGDQGPMILKVSVLGEKMVDKF